MTKYYIFDYIKDISYAHTWASFIETKRFSFVSLTIKNIFMVNAIFPITKLHLLVLPTIDAVLMMIESGRSLMMTIFTAKTVLERQSDALLRSKPFDRRSR